MTPVPSLSGNAPFDQVFSEYIEAKRPCILTGAANGWPARTRWTPDFLCGRYGDEAVDFVDTRTGDRPQRALRSYFGLPEEERAHTYICDWDFRKRSPELLEDLGPLPQFSVDWVNDLPETVRPDLMWIYIGHPGTAGPAHLDNYGTSAWLAVLQGQKRLRFCWPEKGQNPAGEDLFAAKPFADMQEAVLQAGDIVYVPSRTWHAAFNDSYCLSVTANFIDGGSLEDYFLTMTRANFDRRILIRRLNALDDRAAGPGKDREVAHLDLALRRYRARLERQLSDLSDFEEVLEEHRR
ncbi:MAG: hypothetical protein Tsb0019_08980 [Roseibium sp.]